MSKNKHTSSAPVRATLTLRGVVPRAVQRPKAAPVSPPPPPPDDVPPDATLSFCNWRVNFRRPTRRYLTRETALAEARRLRAENQGAIIHTYELRLITEDAS